MFSWDPAKNRSNQKKHGISFEVASLAFEDPLHISRLERVLDGEERWQTIGIVEGILLVLVAHTWEVSAVGEQKIRIISARRANREERGIYEEGL